MKNAAELTRLRHGFENRKRTLTELYKEWYRSLRSNFSSSTGIDLELGSGAGFIKNIIPSCLTSDVIPAENVDLTIDAFRVGDLYPKQIANLILINVFHHIPDSFIFLKSASSSLVPGGRILIIDPSYNFWSYFIYKNIVKHEPFNLLQSSWKFESSDPLLDSNQAQSWIVFNRDHHIFEKSFPDLKIISRRSFMPLSYILSGGHISKYSIPWFLVYFVRLFERRFLDNSCGLFTLYIIEKDSV